MKVCVHAYAWVCVCVRERECVCDREGVRACVGGGGVKGGRGECDTFKFEPTSHLSVRVCVCERERKRERGWGACESVYV